MAKDGYIRIGELSRRTGVSPELLRAWERRYGLFTPDRSPGRFRLYSDSDVLRVQAMRGHLARGLSAAQAARLVVSSPPTPPPEHPGPALAEHRQALREALRQLEIAEMELQHREGYRKKPVKPREFSIWEGEQVWPE